jgi:hypothetical protein
MNRNRLSMVLATALLGSVALVGCKKKEEPVVTPPAAEAPAPMPAEPAPAPVAATTVNSVDLGNTIGADNKIATPNATFATKDPVYASVTTDGPNAGKLAAKWTFQDGQVVHEESKDIPAGPQVTQFQITKPDGWPVGKYKLEVMLDGAVVQTREFEVR